MIRVKICGLTRARDVLAACDAGADALGFVFAKSVRRVSVEQAQGLCALAGPWLSTVGVFVNEKPRAILRIAERCRLSAVQLHGDEKPSDLKTLQSAGFKIIKAFRVGERFDFRALADYPADAYLLDTFSATQYGGSGHVFDWAMLKKIKIEKPWIVSGGLRPDNVASLLRIYRPYGVDVSTGVETKPGIKNNFLIRKFIQNVKAR